jgi:hypothetical protein
MALVRLDRLRHGGSGLVDVAHLPSIAELAGIVELGREEPHEVPGGSRTGMRFVPGLLDWNSLQDTDELRFLCVETIPVILARILHKILPFETAS